MKPTQKNYDVAAWEVLSRQIMRRDGYRCQAACGCTVPLSVHHIIPRDVGGSDDPANLITLCVQCHNEIEQTAIRTAAEVRAYAPRWHATVSWYPTTRPASPKRQRTSKAHLKATRPTGVCAPKLPSGPQKLKRFSAVCESCGRPFISNRRNKKYCTTACPMRADQVKRHIRHPEEYVSSCVKEWAKAMPDYCARIAAEMQEGVSHERDS